MPVVMGRKTFEALSGKPLPGRLNMVITRQKDFSAEGIIVVSSMEEAISIAEKQDYKELFVIGGGEIYKQAISIADKIYLTRVLTEINGDTFFPELDGTVWQIKSNYEVAADAKHNYPFSFQVWEKR